MPQYSTSLSINANQQDVWKVLSDVALWHEWTPTVTKVDVLDASELKLGNRYKVFQPKLQPAVWTVTVLNSPSNFTWESKTSGIHMVAEHILTSKSASQAELTLTFAFNGLLGKLISAIYGKMTADYIQTEAQSLKKRVENK